MPLDTFPADPAPDIGIKRKSKPNIKVAQFGDGYSQRSALGLNQSALNAELSYSNISSAEKTTLEDFINAHNKGQAFYWTMPDEASARKWYITSWEVTYVKFGVFSVNISLTEVFDI